MKLVSKFFIVILLIVSFSQNLYAKSKPKILMLGTSSSIINDVQDRILREQVLQKFLKEKYPIVPVTKIDSLVYQENVNVRNLSKQQIIEFALKYNVDFLLFGKLLKNNNKLKYILSIYNKNKNEFVSKIIMIDENTNFINYCNKLSENIFRSTINFVK